MEKIQIYNNANKIRFVCFLIKIQQYVINN